jgi:hypothetical protein
MTSLTRRTFLGTLAGSFVAAYTTEWSLVAAPHAVPGTIAATYVGIPDLTEGYEIYELFLDFPSVPRERSNVVHLQYAVSGIVALSLVGSPGGMVHWQSHPIAPLVVPAGDALTFNIVGAVEWTLTGRARGQERVFTLRGDGGNILEGPTYADGEGAA